MKYFGLLTALALAVLASGCSKSKPSPTAMPAADYAKDTKNSVLSFVNSAKESPKAAGAQAEMFLEQLQGYAKRQVGDNKDIYEQLVQKCKEVSESAKRSPGDVRKKLDEMAALANKLPG
jgi:hypothetical protein